MKTENMPKIELHVHLDGSVRPETIMELLPNTKEEDIKGASENLKDYLKKFDIPLKIMQTKENLERIAKELAKDLKKDNVIYAEIRFAPMKHLEEGLTPNEVVDSVLNGLKKVDIKTNLILCLMRGADFSSNLEVVNLALKYLDNGVCGLDLAGDESTYKTSDYKEFFEIAKDNDIPFTIHAGEAAGVESINEAIDMGAKRIGHGISCLEDKDTLKRIIDEKIVLEVCPTSNTHTGAVLKYQKHPIYNLYKKGVLVTVNTDNRTVSDITLTKEYSKLIENFGILKEDFINMNKTAIKNSFLKQMEKADLLEKYEEIENNTLE